MLLWPVPLPSLSAQPGPSAGRNLLCAPSSLGYPPSFRVFVTARPVRLVSSRRFVLWPPTLCVPRSSCPLSRRCGLYFCSPRRAIALSYCTLALGVRLDRHLVLAPHALRSPRAPPSPYLSVSLWHPLPPVIAAAARSSASLCAIASVLLVSYRRTVGFCFLVCRPSPCTPWCLALRRSRLLPVCCLSSQDERVFRRAPRLPVTSLPDFSCLAAALRFPRGFVARLSRPFPFCCARCCSVPLTPPSVAVLLAPRLLPCSACCPAIFHSLLPFWCSGGLAGPSVRLSSTRPVFPLRFRTRRLAVVWPVGCLSWHVHSAPSFCTCLTGSALPAVHHRRRCAWCTCLRGFPAA